MLKRSFNKLSRRRRRDSIVKFLRRTKSESQIDVLRHELGDQTKREADVSVEKVNCFLQYLRDHHAEEVEGIFRISGSRHDVTNVLEAVQQNPNSPIVLVDKDPEDAAFIVSTAMKGYLTSAKVPLIPEDLFETFLDTTELPEHVSIPAVRSILQQLPSGYNQIIANLVAYLLEVIALEEKNRMGVVNCGIIFGPIWFRPAKFDAEYILNVPRQSKAVEFVIKNHNSLFQGVADAMQRNPLDLPQIVQEEPDDSPERDGEESEDEVIADHDYDELQQSTMPAAYLELEEERTEEGPHHWETIKSKEISWCICCTKIIAPKSKRKPIKMKQCTRCDKPIHLKCEKGAPPCYGGQKPKPVVQTQLGVGSIAPNIPDLGKRPDGTSFSLYDLLDEGSKVVLFFYPKSFTPLCTAQNKAFRDNFSYFFYANCQVVGVSADTSECQKRFAETYKLPFHLLSDEDGALRKSFQVPTAMGGLMPGRITYIIAPYSRRIMKIHNSNLSATDHIYTSLKIVAELLEMESRVGCMSLVDMTTLEARLD